MAPADSLASQPAVLMRRMTNPVIVGPQSLLLDAKAPMLRFPVEASRSRLTVKLPGDVESAGVIQWTQNGVPIKGENASSIQIENPRVTDSDVYWAEVTRDGQTVRSQSFLLMVHCGFPLQNQSIRGFVQPGKGLTAGFTIGRSSGPLRPRQILIRGVSASLAKFGVSPVLSKLSVSLFRRTTECSKLFDTDPTHLEKVTTKIGAFALLEGGEEFVALVELGPGTYSVVLECDQIECGEALIEIYDTLE
jgi:hypothetical protein